MPADRAIKITLRRSETEETFIPIAIPTGVDNEKQKMNIEICNKLKPVLAKAAPRDIAAQDL